jgi:hypothetical protein
VGDLDVGVRFSAALHALDPVFDVRITHLHAFNHLTGQFWRIGAERTAVDRERPLLADEHAAK